VIPYFESENPKYSYLDIPDLNTQDVRRTKEKEVISTHASSGTYYFRSLSVFLAAAAMSVSQRDDYQVKGALFICPTFNPVIHAGWKVVGLPVRLERCVSTWIKTLEATS
jgi:hypothetical protein